MKALIYIIYDSINNSVFESQVIAPLQKWAQQNPQASIIIVSFEKHQLSQEEIAQKIPSSFQYYIFKRVPFLGRFTLFYHSIQLMTIVRKFSSSILIARGPFAGYIAKKVLKKGNECIIQARGLAAQEYAYTTQDARGIRKIIAQQRYNQLNSLEKSVYSTLPPNCTIEAVSRALKQYLCTSYNTAAQQVLLACADIPPEFDAATVAKWRTAHRTALNIDASVPVYCYSGSLKPWQCPEETIIFFKKKLNKEPNSFLLVLTPEIKEFCLLAKKYNLASQHYRVLYVKPENLYSWLATADYGFLLREKHIMNWVSRPTKLLEYQAVGLKIIHNNTVALLCE